MTIRTQLRAGGVQNNHSEALQVRSAIKAGSPVSRDNEVLQHRSAITAGALIGSLRGPTAVKVGRAALLSNHSEALQVRTALTGGRPPTGDYGGTNHNEQLQVRTALKGGGHNLNHNEAL